MINPVHVLLITYFCSFGDSQKKILIKRRIKTDSFAHLLEIKIVRDDIHLHCIFVEFDHHVGGSCSWKGLLVWTHIVILVFQAIWFVCYIRVIIIEHYSHLKEWIMHDLNKTKQSSQTCILRCQIDYEWFSSAKW